MQAEVAHVACWHSFDGCVQSLFMRHATQPPLPLQSPVLHGVRAFFGCWPHAEVVQVGL
jgi:hypothetical protein